MLLNRTDEVAWVSVRNLPHVHVIAPDQLNTYDVLVNDDVVFTKDSLDVFLASKAQQGRGSAEGAAVVVDEEASK